MPNTQSPSSTDLTPIKTNLFRFLNITDPSLTKRDTDNMIGNSQLSSSHFYSGLESLTTQAAIDSDLSTKISSFTPYASIQDIKAVNPNLQKLGEWIDTNKKPFVLTELQSKTNGLSALGNTDIGTLWDNIYYQALTGESDAKRDLCIQLLRANKFLAAFVAMGQLTVLSAAQAKQLDKIAAAYAVIPSRLVVREKLDLSNPNNPINADTTSHLDALSAIDIARFQISRYSKAIEELKCAQNCFWKENTAAYTAAYQDYLDAFDPENPSDFDYTPTLQLNDAYVQSKVSSETNGIYLENKSNCASDIDAINKKLGAKLETEYNNIVNNTKPQSKAVILNDLVLPINRKPLSNTLTLRAVKLLEGSDLHTIFLTHYYENPNFKATLLDVTLDFGGSVTSNSKSRKPFAESDKHTTHQLFPNGVSISSSQNSLGVTLSYSFNDSNFNTTQTLTGYNPHGNEYWPFPISVNSYNDGVPGNDKVRLFGVTKVGVGEFMRVEQEVCCYVPGLVSHIENVMAREYKERSTRSLNRMETTTEETTDRESEKQTDTSTTDRYELHSEVSRVIAEQNATQIGANVGVTVSPSKAYSLNAGLNVNTSFSSSATNSFNEAETKAKEITTKATERILEKVSYKRTAKMLEEFEDTNKHGFDNRQGTSHVTGIYRWVDILYKNNLYNYGKRLIYDFMVPEPAKNFKSWMTSGNSADTRLQTLVEPTNPSTLLPHGPSDVNEYNFASIAARYGADVDNCPKATLEIANSFSDSPTKNGVEKDGVTSASFDYDLAIPDGYHCRFFKYGTYIFRGVKQDSSDWKRIATLHLKIANHEYTLNCFDGHNGADYDHMSSSVDISGYLSKDLGLTVNTRNVGSFTVNTIHYCELTNAAYRAWQNQTYLAIYEAYNKQLKAYNDAMANVKASDSTNTKIDYSFNPDFARSIEQRELKRLCIELMTAPFGINMGRNNYNATAVDGIYKMAINAGFEDHAILTKFFEQAFDWQIMAYIMYPYFWAEDANWHNLIKESSSADPIFQAFLQSGMSRVSVPVRVGFEKAVMYFLDTGRVWRGNNALHDGMDGMYLSIADELKVDEGTIVATWETRLPTTLNILQKDAAPLDENGLPCFEKFQLDGVTPCGCSSNAMAQGSSILERDTVIDCTTYNNRYATLLAEHQALVDAYDDSSDPTSLCATTLAGLKLKAQLLSALITSAAISGCTTSVMESGLADLNAQIVRITGLCG
jgi:hypothetical protein